MTTKAHAKFLLGVLVLIAIVLCGWKPLRVTPTSICQIDDKMTSYTGKQRDNNGVTECQYKHINFAYNGSFFTEAPHVAWEACRYE